jgi:hypothetical protein
MPSMRGTLLRLCRVYTEDHYSYAEYARKESTYTQFKRNLVGHTLAKQIFVHTEYKLNIIHCILNMKKVFPRIISITNK